jgi:hypothetical protein
MEETLRAIFYDPKNKSSFSSVSKLYEAAKAITPSVTRKDVKEWLDKQETYTLHAPVRRRFTRSRIYVKGIDKLWQADLMDMAGLSNWNKLPNEKKILQPINFVLVIICVFSKYLFAIPLFNKTAQTTSKAIFALLDRLSPRKPASFQTDKGSVEYCLKF